jgi:uncharacterized membrane protein
MIPNSDNRDDNGKCTIHYPFDSAMSLIFPSHEAIVCALLCLPVLALFGLSIAEQSNTVPHPRAVLVVVLVFGIIDKKRNTAMYRNQVVLLFFVRGTRVK